MAAFFKKRTIKTNKTIGQILQSCRSKKGVSLEQAEEKTQIRLKYLRALEKDDYSKFSAKLYAIGFLSRYSDYLGLPSEELINRYKIDSEIATNIQRKNIIIDKDNETTPFLTRTPDYLIRKTAILINPQTMLSLLIGFFVIALMGYIWFQVKSFAASPEIEINNPASEIVVSMENVLVEGKTDSGASLFINNQSVPIDSQGYFKQEIKLVSGLNTIEIKARNKADKETKKTIQVLAKY